MTRAAHPSLFERPLRADLAAFFVMRERAARPASHCCTRPLCGILAELAREGRLR